MAGVAQLAQNLSAVSAEQKSLGGLEVVFGPRHGELTILRSFGDRPLATMWPGGDGKFFVMVDGETVAGPISRKHGLVVMMDRIAEVLS